MEGPGGAHAPMEAARPVHFGIFEAGLTGHQGFCSLADRQQTAGKQAACQDCNTSIRHNCGGRSETGFRKGVEEK